ncbi:hypothetical protein TNCV_4424621 [Trichonephila clavipes]|nr:hypothetical protein TNCV_4424621 [Trichonephila clavipes]
MMVNNSIDFQASWNFSRHGPTGLGPRASPSRRASFRSRLSLIQQSGRVVGSLVVRASDFFTPVGLGSMPVPPNTLPVHTEYVLVKSVGSKILWAVAAETTIAGDWRIFPFPPVSCLNCGGGVAIYRKD